MSRGTWAADDDPEKILFEWIDDDLDEPIDHVATLHQKFARRILSTDPEARMASTC